jgi:hypothetical protein
VYLPVGRYSKNVVKNKLLTSSVTLAKAKINEQKREEP